MNVQQALPVISGMLFLDTLGVIRDAGLLGPAVRPPRSYLDRELADVVARMCGALSKLPGPGRADAPYQVETGSFDEPALLDAATRLCDDGEFHEALPIALHLMASSGGRADAAFMAASCLQRCGHLELALSAFLQVTLADGPQPAAWFRLGECLEATGRPEEAVEAYDRAVDHAREDPAYEPVQQLAQRRAEQARAH